MDMTDEQIIAEVLKRLAHLSLREAEEAGPVSRGTLNNWQRGVQTMHPATRRKCLAWLDAAPAAESPSYADGMAAAIERMEAVLAEMRVIVRAGDGDADQAEHARDALERARGGRGERGPAKRAPG